MQPTLLIVSLLACNSIFAQTIAHNESLWLLKTDNESHANAVVRAEEKVEEDIVERIPVVEKNHASSDEAIPADAIKNIPPPERTLATRGIALWLDSPSKENTQNFYALHKYLPIGTIIKVINPMNERLIEVKVIGKLPDLQEYQNIAIMVSAATAQQLNVLDEKFIVKMVIPVSAIHNSGKK